MSDETSAEFEQAIERARQVLAGGQSELVQIGSAAPEVVRASYGTQLADATRAADTLRAVAKKREQELRAELGRRLAELNETMAPLTAMVKRLEEGLWTVNLYLGRDEQIKQLADGEPAPDGTPITLRQLVLAMDEECLVAVNEGGVDARRVGDFAEWLVADPRHLNQVMPDPKGVVVLVASRQHRNYGDTFINGHMAEANKVSHWLIRNGERVYLMVTDIEVGDRMLPTREEFVEFFYDVDRWGEHIPLEPGSEAWVKAEQSADARRRHYMRIMLVLQGLADRTTVFQPLPGPVNFLSLDSQDSGYVRIVNELDLVLTTGRPSFRDWQRDLLTRLRPGMRIVGEFGGRQFDPDGRVQPATAGRPDSLKIHIVTDRGRGGTLMIRYGYRIWDKDDWQERDSKVRATCTLYQDDNFILPVDQVTIAELETYLHARTERHQYLTMVPVIKAVIEAKRAEEAAEAPFRLLLAGFISDRFDVDVAEVEAQLPELVDWWKLTNRWHRPLVSDDQEIEKRAISRITQEWMARGEAANGGNISTELVQTLRAADPAAICVARRRDGSYATFAPAEPGQKVWLTEKRYTGPGPRSAGGRLIQTTEWTIVSGKTLSTLTVAWSTDEWTGWNHDASRAEHLTGPELRSLTQRMVELVGDLGQPIAVVYQPGGGNSAVRSFRTFAWATTPRSVSRHNGPSGGISEPGDLMTSIFARWVRRHGEAVLVDICERNSPRWNSYDNEEWGNKTPWSGGCEQLVWSDESHRPRIDAIYAEIAERNRAVNASVNRHWKIQRGLIERWEAVQWDRLYQRFLTDYAGATDLWDGHRKSLRVSANLPHYLDRVIGELVAAGVDMAGMTVADAVAAAPHNGKWVKTLPDDLAAMPLVASEDTPE